MLALKSTFHLFISKSTDIKTSTLHEAAAEGDLKTLKRLVQDLDDKNPPIGK